MAKILLIDDSEALLVHIGQMLRTGGHTVMATSNGAEAIGRLSTGAADLVLTDLYMPPPDGFEIISAVRGLARPVPLIVMSTNPLSCDVFRAARALGASAALQKPFTADQLLEAVAEALDLGHPAQEAAVAAGPKPSSLL